MRVSGLFVAGLLALAPVLAAAPPEPTAQDLERDVYLLRWIRSLDLTAEQAATWAEESAAAAAAARDLEAKWNAPEVAEAVRAIREAALRGQPITDAMQAAVWAARAKAFGLDDRDDLDGLHDLRVAALGQHVNAMLAGLEPVHLHRIVQPDLVEDAEQWYRAILDGLTMDEERWTARLEGALEGVRDRRDEGGEAIAEELAALCESIRQLAVQQIHQRADELRRELSEVLAPRLETDRLNRRAAERLMSLLVEEVRLPVCLADWAAANPG